jgi:hypothetical protein
MSADHFIKGGIMEINLKCRCGSSFSIEDQRQIFINPGGLRDEKGRMFVVQVQADEWLDRHQNCLIEEEEEDKN